MSPVSVVTDTTHYLPRELVASSELHEVSLYVNFGPPNGSLQRESDITDYAVFYDQLRTADSLPTTSQPSIGDFLAVYEPLLEQGRDVVAVLIAGGISGTLESARQAAEEALRSRPGRRIEVVDSLSSAGGLGLIALAGSAAARAGADVDAVVERIEAAKEATKIWFAVDTLEYLRRGGRIGTAQAWLGGALKIKPILTLNGEITPLERVRTSGRAFERMVDYMHARDEDGADCWVIQHIQAHDVAERLIERGRDIFGTEPYFVSEVGPVIGAHIGPGLVGVGGLPMALLR